MSNIRPVDAGTATSADEASGTGTGAEHPGTGAADSEARAEAPGTEELQEQTEQTRAELADTVEALAAKTDVKGRAKEKATQLKLQAQQKARSSRVLVRQRRTQVGLGAVVVAALVAVVRRRRA
ncbi:MAG TPA: DUF3618 domain-containing protein [Streptosporangiaceae bacterium]|jgi:hypothetical protein